MTNRYDDILYLPHKQSDARQRMSRASRAAQFAPFAALVGYGDALNETMRKTEEKIDLSDDQIDGLNFKIAYLGAHMRIWRVRIILSESSLKRPRKNRSGRKITERNAERRNGAARVQARR